MPLLQRATPSLLRPSIHDLSAFLFPPQTSCALGSIIRHRQFPSAPSTRPFSTRPRLPAAAPRSHDRGPPSREATQTDFGSLDVLGSAPAPSTNIDACLWDGFHFNSGVKIVGSGALLVAGEAFAWSPWEARQGKRKLVMVNEKGQFEVEEEAWGLLGLVWPKPDMLILGLGRNMRPISPKTRQHINDLGIRIDIQDTRNAAAQFNLLATERGVGSIAAALVPIGWREGVGIK